MNSENASSGKTSATMSSTEPQKPKQDANSDHNAPPAPDVAADKLSESEYVAQQAAAAKAAIGQVLANMKAHFGEGANPAEWAKQYPWITMGAGAVAGFVAASVLIPSKEQQALKKLVAIERALNPAPPREKTPSSDSKPGKEGDQPAPGGFMGILARELIGTIRPALVSLITAGMTAKVAKPDENEQGTGG